VSTPVSVDDEVTVTVDTSRLAVSGATLLYSLNAGPAQSLTQPGNGGATYSFTVPGSALPEGTDVDYAFVLSGTFLDSACAGVSSVAVAPTNHGFASLSTSDASSANLHLLTVTENAGYMLKDQPANGTLSLAQACSTLFAAPTPCDIYPQGPVTTTVPGGTVPSLPLQTSTVQLAATTSPGCSISADERTVYLTLGWGGTHHDFPTNTGDTHGGVAAPRVTQSYSSSRNAVLQDVFDGGSGFWTSGYSTATGQARVGFAFGVTSHDQYGNVVANPTFTYTLDWYVAGQDQARAADWAMSAGVLGFAEGAAYARDDPEAIAIAHQNITHSLSANNVAIWTGPGASAYYNSSLPIGWPESEQTHPWGPYTEADSFQYTPPTFDSIFYYASILQKSNVAYDGLTIAQAESNANDSSRSRPWYLQVYELAISSSAGYWTRC